MGYGRCLSYSDRKAICKGGLDRRKAVSFYQMGVARTNAAAMVRLADAYQMGDVIKQNEAKAMQLYRRAARMGNLEARIMVGDQVDAP